MEAATGEKEAGAVAVCHRKARSCWWCSCPHWLPTQKRDKKRMMKMTMRRKAKKKKWRRLKILKDKNATKREQNG